MKVGIVSKTPKEIEKEFRANGIEVVKTKPDMIICYGGDGTLFFAEEKYPGIPKLFLYQGVRSKRKKEPDFTKIIRKLKKEKYKIKELDKIQAEFNNKKMVGMNDINIHYKLPYALRFLVKVDKKLVSNGIAIGDGLVIATPYGSTGYHYSITRRKFSRGLGLVFNNTREKIRNRFLRGKELIRVKIERGSGQITADCQKPIELKTGDIIEIKKSEDKAKMVKLKGYKLTIMKY